MCLDLEVVSVALKNWNIGLQWIWLFWATFGRIQKNISYLTDNFPKQGYKVLFFPLPRCNYANDLMILKYCILERLDDRNYT